MRSTALTRPRPPSSSSSRAILRGCEWAPKTAPGDQVFVQVVGVEGVYVVDAGFLQYLPRTPDDWRSTALVDLRGLTPDRLVVTNGAKVFELRRDGTNKLWRMTYPLQARANNAKIEELLQMLQNVRVSQFVPDDPKLDLETFGLRPPELEVALSQGTNYCRPPAVREEPDQ